MKSCFETLLKLTSKKGYVLILIMFNYNVSSYAQTLNDLDKKKGFKDFVIGDNFKKWADYIYFDKKENSDSLFKYVADYQTLFNTYSLHDIILRFSSSKLVEINLVLNKWDNGKDADKQQSLKDYTDKFVDIGNRFKLLFGSPTFTDSPKETINNKEIYWVSKVGWTAKKISLLVTFTYAELSNVGVVSVQIFDNAHLVKSYTGGF